jgi:hypothetical protein
MPMIRQLTMLLATADLVRKAVSGGDAPQSDSETKRD